jgi:hypothetical protein
VAVDPLFIFAVEESQMKSVTTLAAAVLLFSALPARAQIAPGDDDGGGGSVQATTSNVDVKGLTLTVTPMGNQTIQAKSKADFYGKCSATEPEDMVCYCKLTVDVRNKANMKDVIQDQVTVPVGMEATWSFDNSNPGPAPTFSPIVQGDLIRAMATIIGFVGSAPVDNDISFKSVQIP